MRFSVINVLIMLSFIWIAKGENHTDVDLCSCEEEEIFCKWHNKKLTVNLGSVYSVVNFDCNWMMEKVKEVFVLSLIDSIFCAFSNQRTTSDVAIKYIKDYEMQWTCNIRKSGSDVPFTGKLPTTLELANRFPEMLSGVNKSDHYVFNKQHFVRTVADPIVTMFKGRHLIETPCIPPDDYLATASLSCRVHPNHAFCVERCIFGYTLPGGIQQNIYCSPETGWYPHAIRECQPFVDCHVELLYDGSLNCSSVTFTKGPICTAECYNRTDDGITFTHAASDVYTCDVDGWDKAMPYCLSQGSGIALVKAPSIKRHQIEKYHFDYARDFPNFNPKDM